MTELFVEFKGIYSSGRGTQIWELVRVLSLYHDGQDMVADVVWWLDYGSRVH